jgi:hypothetical protein
MPEPANPKLPTLWLAGDSTVKNGSGEGPTSPWGWGDLIADYLPGRGRASLAGTGEERREITDPMTQETSTGK